MKRKSQMNRISQVSRYGAFQLKVHARRQTTRLSLPTEGYEVDDMMACERNGGLLSLEDDDGAWPSSNNDGGSRSHDAPRWYVLFPILSHGLAYPDYRIEF